MYGYEHVGMGFGMVLVWVIPIVLVVLLIRFLLIRDRFVKSGKNAREILDERYARGEIDRDEYLKRRADL